MSEPSIAQQIANKRIQRRKLVKLAQGHQSRPNVSAVKPAATSVGGLNSSAATTGVAAGRGRGANLPRANRFQAPAAKKTLFAPEQSVGGAFVSGMGQGVGNMLGGMADFGRGAVRAITAPFAAEIGRAMHSDPAAGDAYADDMYRHYEKAWGDVGNSFGRFVGVYDAWDPSTGQYRGAQPANATKQHTQEIGEKYFGDTTATPTGRAYNLANRVGDGAAEAIPLAAGGGAIGRQLAQRAAGLTGVTANPVVNNAVTYGLGIPTKQLGAGGTAVFAGSNIVQNTAGGLIEAAPQAAAALDARIEQMRSAGFQGTPEFEKLVAQRNRWNIGTRLNEMGVHRFLPAYQLDQVTRNVAGDYAPEAIDALRAGTVGGAAATLTSQMVPAEALMYRAEGQQHANAQQAQAQAQNMQQTLDQHANLVTQITDAENAGAFAQLDDASRAQYDALLQSLEGQNTPGQVATMQQMNRILNGEAVAQPTENQLGTDATTEAPQPNLTEGQPTAPADPAAVSTAVQASLPEGTTPEQAKAADEAAAALANAPNKPQTPEDAAALVENSEGSSIERLAQERAQENPPPTDNPRDWGQWFEETMSWATDAWNNLGFVGQLAFGLGMPLGVIGLLGGGLSGVLTAALGFGVAGLAAAGSGALGETAQGAVMDTAAAAGAGAQNAVSAVTDTAQPAQPATGLKPATEMLSQEQLQTLTPQQIAAIESARSDPAKFRESASKAFWAAKTGLPAGEFGEFLRLPPDVMNTLFQQLPPAEQQSLLRSLRMAGSMAGRNKEMGAAINNAVTNLTREKNSMFNSKSASHIVAQHIAIATMHKAARCWSGYEPVPGKKPYSNDSCRPIGGKKKKKKDKAAK